MRHGGGTGGDVTAGEGRGVGGNAEPFHFQDGRRRAITVFMGVSLFSKV